MIALPPFIQRVPTALYWLAAVFFLWSFYLTVNEIRLTAMPYVDMSDPVVRQALLRGLYQGAMEAIYIACNGAVIHVLLAIWSKGQPPKVDEESE